MRVGRRIAEPDGESLLAIREQALVAGVPEEQAARVAAEAWNEALERVGPRMLRTLHRTAPRMLRRERWARQRFQRRIRRYWGRALDRYIMVTAAAEDCGRAFHVRNRTAAVAIDDYRFEALTGLHARACRIAKEIDRLLSGGFAKGALARCRTLHELAVTAEVIATYGRAEGDYADLAERFVRHEAVTAYKDVLEYQQHRDVLGYEPFDDAAVAALKAESDEVIRRFGAGYGRSYGWARPLFDKNDPTFRDLEQLAELSHLRSHYRWASAEIHAGAKGWALNIETFADVDYLGTAADLRGLADPGHFALISLVQATTSVILSSAEPSQLDLIAASMLLRLLDQAGDEFSHADDRVERAAAKRSARRFRAAGRRRQHGTRPSGAKQDPTAAI